MQRENKWQDRFDEKFPWRIYGIAGEPKTEFIESINKPEDIKSFIQSEIDRARAEERKRVIAEITEGARTMRIGNSEGYIPEDIARGLKKLTDK